MTKPSTPRQRRQRTFTGLLMMLRGIEANCAILKGRLDEWPGAKQHLQKAHPLLQAAAAEVTAAFRAEFPAKEGQV